MTRLETLCEAIKKKEGWYFLSRSWRNNNPGNLVYSRFQSGHDGRFSRFPNFFTGWLGLWFDVYCKCLCRTRTGLSGESTIKAFAAVWAPDSDGNDSRKYAQDIAEFCNVTADTKLKYFLEDIV